MGHSFTFNILAHIFFPMLFFVYLFYFLLVGRLQGQRADMKRWGDEGLGYVLAGFVST